MRSIINIVGALFLGSQLLSIAHALELKACTEYAGFTSVTCTNEETVTNYCIEDNKIYGLNSGASNACVHNTLITLTESALNVVYPGGKISSSTLGTEITGLITTPANYIIVDCSSTNCKQTSGYIKNDSNYYAFIGTAGGVAVGDTLIESTVTASDNCEADHIGKLINDKSALCIRAGNAVTFTTDTADTVEHLILANTAVARTPFEDTTNTVAIKRDANYIVKDNFYNGDTNGIFLEYGTNKVIDRKTNFCSGTILNELYSCTNGVCTKEDKQVDAGKYLVNGKMYNFQKVVNSNKINIVEETDTDVFVYAQTDETDTTYSTIVTTFTTLESNSYIYNCKNGECTKVEGYIKYGTSGSEELAYCDGTSACAKIEDAGKPCATAGTDEGNIQIAEGTPKTIKICVDPANTTSENKMIDISTNGVYIVQKNTNYLKYKVVYQAVVGKSSSENGYYLVANNQYVTTANAEGTLIYCNNNVCNAPQNPSGTFINAGGDGLINCDSESHNCSLASTVSNGFTVGHTDKLLYCSSNNCSIVSTTGDQYFFSNDSKLIHCNSGCNKITDAVGYFVNADVNTKNDNPYIGCYNENCSLIVKNTLDQTTACSEAGVLIKDGVLCLTGTNTEKKGFTDDGDWLVSYHVNSIFKNKYHSGEFAVITITSNSMMIKDISVPICVDSTTLAVTTKSGECGSGTTAYQECASGICTVGTVPCDPESPSASCIASNYYLKGQVLYQCSSSSSCKTISDKGYYINFDGNNVSEVFTCDQNCANVSSTKLATGGCVSPDDTGKIFKSADGVASICVYDGTNSNNSIKLENKTPLVLIPHHNNNIFGTTESQYVMVIMKSNSITVKIGYKNTVRFVYTNGDHEVLARTGNCDAAGGVKNVKEFQCVTTTGICDSTTTQASP